MKESVAPPSSTENRRSKRPRGTLRLSGFKLAARCRGGGFFSNVSGRGAPEREGRKTKMPPITIREWWEGVPKLVSGFRAGKEKTRGNVRIPKARGKCKSPLR